MSFLLSQVLEKGNSLMTPKHVDVDEGFLNNNMLKIAVRFPMADEYQWIHETCPSISEPDWSVF